MTSEELRQALKAFLEKHEFRQRLTVIVDNGARVLEARKRIAEELSVAIHVRDYQNPEAPLTLGSPPKAKPVSSSNMTKDDLVGRIHELLSKDEQLDFSKVVRKDETIIMTLDQKTYYFTVRKKRGKQ